ncbi:MAG TPA: FAD-dependent oxidoreductase [Aeromicrobium sp.]|nr:FAD-dependent oxidoreductase [Aeromicrobium sp.]
MPHVVTQPCCADASCVFACPVNAIHPTPDEPDFATADMVYIDPQSCVDCGACVGACPVGAIKPDTKLAEHELPFIELNRLFHQDRPTPPVQAPVTPIVGRRDDAPLGVAIVGSGPAGMYAADEVLRRPGTEVTVIDRLPTPYGLVRAGVAPDHPETRTVDRLFRMIEDQSGFSYALDVEVGQDVTHAQLVAGFDAVIYATGASDDRSLGIDGEDLPGSGTATDFVAWYNGHPDHVDDRFDLSHERVVIVGNGNVAIDVARILATDPEQLARTDIADHALEALRRSAVREVVILARRGPAQSAFTLPEITGLVQRDDIEVVVEGDLSVPTGSVMDDQKLQILRTAPARPGRRRIVLRYQCAPVALLGDTSVTGVRVAATRLETYDGIVRAVLTDDHEDLEAGLVLRSVGYRGRALPDLPFDDARGVVPNVRGRVEGEPGVYVVGWIKRGPTGFIGTNKTCATESVNRLFEDLNAGSVARGTGLGLPEEVRRSALGVEQWRQVDRWERRQGLSQGRPRVRMTNVDDVRRLAAVSPVVPRRSRLRRRVILGA